MTVDISPEAIATRVAQLNAGCCALDGRFEADLLEALGADRDRLARDLTLAKIDLGVEAELQRAVAKERDKHLAEIARLRGILERDPNVVLIAHQDGDRERLARVTGKAIERAKRAEAERDEAKRALADLLERVEINGGLGEYNGGVPFAIYNAGKVLGRPK